MKTSVTIRTRDLKNGSKTIYLDIFHNGKRSREFLGLYILPGNDSLTRAKNKNSMNAAKVLQAKRLTDIVNNKAGIRQTSKIRLSDYFQTFIESRSERCSEHTIRQVLWCKMTWDNYKPGIYIIDVTPEVVNGYVKFLDNYRSRFGRLLNPNTKIQLINKTKTLFNSAVRSDLIANSPFDKVTISTQGKQTDRCFLTIEDLKLLIDTPCKYPVVKQMFLFSCFTGLRYSDVSNLRWDSIIDGMIKINQQKTGEPVTIPLSANAKEWMPERMDSPLVFAGAEKYYTVARIISRWAKKAGINKHVTFHVSRHTFATLELTYGADLYTVSKLLGHTNIATTQIYAKIVDEKKVKAVNLIPTLQ